MTVIIRTPKQTYEVVGKQWHEVDLAINDAMRYAGRERAAFVTFNVRPKGRSVGSVPVTLNVKGIMAVEYE